MRPTPPLTSIVRSLPATVPFVGPETLERRSGRPLALRLGANESGFGVSPAAAAAMRAAVDEIWKYNDPEAHDLTAALARHHGLDADGVHVGAGIDEILGLLVRVFVEPGQAVVTSLGSYPTLNYHVHGHGARLVEVPYRDDAVDLPGLARAAADSRAPLVYLANPDNPMGTWHDADAVLGLLAQLPADCMLILDEAYADFAPPSAIPGPVDDPRLLRTRTFSKAHGMAGARVGYALADAEVVSALGRVCNHFGVNRLAQVGALASLGDPGFVAGVVTQVEAGRRQLQALAAELGLRTVPSATNFVNVDLGGDGERARAALQGLLARDVFVRMPGKPPGDRCLRVTVGPTAQLQAFARALRDTLAELTA